jgi:transglycosylase-like protein
VLTKRTYTSLVLVLLAASPAVALAATGEERAPRVARAASPRIGLGNAKPVAIAALIRPGPSLHSEMRAAAKRIRVARRARLRRERREAFATLPGGVSLATLEAIASCESGGDPSAVSADGSYRGKYQFSYETWTAVGGSGDPAAASEAEQDYRAALLYAQSGSSPWPVCG